MKSTQKITCTCCERTLNPATMVALELDQRIGEYHNLGGVPSNESQGWFDFGQACAKKKIAAARKALTKAGIAVVEKPAEVNHAAFSALVPAIKAVAEESRAKLALRKSKRLASRGVAPKEIQLGIPKGGEVYSFASVFPRGTTVDNLKSVSSLARVFALPDGTLASCDQAAARDLDAADAMAFAEELVRRYNAHERLLAALDMATATVELGTGNGAQSQPAAWPKTGNGDVDVEAVAKYCRTVVELKGRG